MILSKTSKLAALVISVLFLVVLKYVIDNSAEALSQILQLIAYMSLPVAGGLVTFSFCSLLGAFSDVEDSATSHLLRRLSEYPARNFFIGFLGTAYLALVRPRLAVNLLFLPYVEWVTIALAVYVVYNMIRPYAEEFHAGSEGLGWKRHIQEVRRETGHDLIRTTSVMELFIDQGVKEPLLVYLTLHLQRLGETEEEILRTLSPLVDYQKDAGRPRFHFLAFPWTKKKLAMREKKAREDLLKTLLERINWLVSK